MTTPNFGTTFHSSWRQGMPPSCRITPAQLLRLCDDLNKFSAEAAEKEISSLQQGTFSTPDFEQLKEAVRASYKMHIEIVGTKGEYFASTQTGLLDESQLPAEVDRITLDSSFAFRAQFRNDPKFKIRLVFDFRKAPLFDFVTNPSLSTRNDSFIEISGPSDTWVSGVYESIVSTLKNYATKRGWLHRQSIYDLFLWGIVLPLAFWNLNKLLSAYSALLQDSSSVLIVFGHIYFFVVTLFLFRGFFNYGRWLFPFVELTTSLQSISVKHRIVFVTLSAGLTYGLFQDLVRTVLRLIF